ncbi:MAG: hypothetical protein IKP44_03950 [Bacteroidaceae bacterium]|nr:hypothetical protein [Bacteroidaceae bacterium]
MEKIFVSLWSQEWLHLCRDIGGIVVKNGLNRCNCSVIITASELAIGMEVATVNKP